MCTYRGDNNWNLPNWPLPDDELPDDNNAVCEDMTEWIYDSDTGLLTGKKDAEGNSVTYSYEPDGKLETRTWARENGSIVTTYGYDLKTGELLTVDYSDATPDITFTYDRLGRQKTVTDAAGHRIFHYNDNLQPEYEDINGLYNKKITRKYDTRGRSAGFFMGTDYDTTYDYESATGRFRSVALNIAGSQKTAVYYYKPGSDLIERVETGSGMTNDIVTAYEYESKRNLKMLVKNEFPGIDSPLISQYEYTYDDFGRRSHAVNTGRAFTDHHSYEDGAFSEYKYNDRSELTASHRYEGTDIQTGIPVDPETRIYSYDSIGNRKTAEEHTLLRTYSANSLNQYDEITTGSQTEIPAYDEDGNMTA